MFSHLSYSRSPTHRRNDTQIPQFTRVSPSRLGIVDLGSTTIATLAVLASCIFILTMCSAFFGADEGEPYIQNLLDAVTESEPGVCLRHCCLMHHYLRCQPRLFFLVKMSMLTSTSLP
jgi:hypothetical protein